MFYRDACAGFSETQRKIDALENPYGPQDDDSGEPPYLEEWQAARDASLVVGETCVSMLSASLKIFLLERIGAVFITSEAGKKVLKNKGVLLGYRDLLSEAGFTIEDAPIDYKLLEEIELVRNHAQHPHSILDINARFSKDSLKKVPSPIFVDKDETLALLRVVNDDGRYLVPPPIFITPETMELAIVEVEQFCKWFDNWMLVNEPELRAAAPPMA
jgi:hypothetical protein